MSAYGNWAPYVPVATRRRQTARELARLTQGGQAASPVIITGRHIAGTPWGRAWCSNMERYSDDANRLPRGRTYVRNGSVIDLQIGPGQVQAQVSGSSIYRTMVEVQPLAKSRWQALCADCAGGIDSLVELLQGRFSQAVMDRLCRPGDGLFPAPRDIRFDCSCPDGAFMCKHVAAVLYGVGARLDSQPELLFTLRQVEAADLLSKAGTGVATTPAAASHRALAEDDLGALFGLDLEGDGAAVPAAKAPAPAAPSIKATPTSARTAPAASTPLAAPAKPLKTPRPTAPARPPGRSVAVARNPAARLLAALRKTGWLDNAAARAATGLDAEAVRPLLRQLVAEGHAQVQGRGRGTLYVARRTEFMP